MHEDVSLRQGASAGDIDRGCSRSERLQEVGPANRMADTWLRDLHPPPLPPEDAAELPRGHAVGGLGTWHDDPLVHTTTEAVHPPSPGVLTLHPGQPPGLGSLVSSTVGRRPEGSSAAHPAAPHLSRQAVRLGFALGGQSSRSGTQATSSAATSGPQMSGGLAAAAVSRAAHPGSARSGKVTSIFGTESSEED
jgi:hypothetical protein